MNPFGWARRSPRCSTPDGWPLHFNYLTLNFEHMARPIDAWGDSHRHYSGARSESDAIHMVDQWERAVERVVPECRAVVERTLKLWNLKVRSQLATEIGFQLQRRHVRVRVADGLPAPLSGILGGTDGLELLLLNQALLRDVVAGTWFMESVRDRVKASDGTIVGPARPRDIRIVRETAEAWLKLIKGHDVGKALRRIDEDVLGAYFYRRGEVKVYWLAVGIFSALHAVPLQALTVVVLAHELAHAYTHLGFDIDGYDWPTERFGSTDIAIIEGLAQFYTEIVCKNLEAQMPEAIQAFRHLMSQQSEIYSTHRAWVREDERDSGEIVRVSLVECRRSGKEMHRDDFAQTVKKRRQEISGR